MFFFLDLVGLDLGAETATEGAEEGCFLDFRTERTKSTQTSSFYRWLFG